MNQTELPLNDWTPSGEGETRLQRIVALDAERQQQRTDRAALTVVGKGEQTTYWRNMRWRLEPNRTYAFRVRLKGEGTGGCAIVGANVANRDFIPTREWQTAEYVFRTPADTRDAFVRVGHWQWRGEILFDQPQLVPVEVVHTRYGDLTLGEGEVIRNGRYTFTSRLDGALSNTQAPIREFTADFNTNRFVFSPNAQATFRHAIGDYRIRRATLRLHVPYEQDGALAIHLRKDEGDWQAVHLVRERGAHEFEIPPALLPARTLEVRLIGQSGVIQVDRYTLDAELERAPRATLAGRSLALYPLQQARALQVKPLALQRDAQGKWSLLIEVANPTPKSLAVRSFQQTARASRKHLGEQSVRLAPSQSVQVALSLPEPSAHSDEPVVGLVDERDRVVWSVRLKPQARFLEWAHYGYRLAGAPDWAGMWWCEWGWKVGRTRGLPLQTRPAVRASAARGEYEPVQIVLRPPQPLRLLKAELSDLQSGKHRIRASHFELREVAYVYVEHPTDGLGAPDEYPDPLPPLQLPLDLAAGQNQPLWLTFYAPYGTPAGVYRGSLTLHTDRGVVAIPLEFTVYDFDLPRTPTLRSGFGVSAERVFLYHKPRTEAQKRELWDRYMQAFRRARLNPYNFYLNWYGVRLENGQVALDFSEFDLMARRYLDELGFNSFVLPIYGLPGGRYPNYSQAEFLGYKEGTPEYERLWSDYMRQLQEHLRKNGWLHKAYIYWYDEPEEADYPFVRRVNERIKRAAPDLTVMLTEQPEPPLIGSVDLWCPLTAFVPLDSIRQRRAAGEEVWWYVCTGPRAPYATLFIDHPGTEMRVWLWQTRKYGVQGVLIWDTTWWHNQFAYPDRLQNPWNDPMSYVWDARFKPGTREFWGNGDGRLLYPPRRDPNASNEPIIADPIPSLRWECLRDGAEDYEYFALLERLIEQAERKQVDAALLNQARALLRVPDSVVKSMTEFTFDPRPLNEHRDKLAAMIVRLQRALQHTNSATSLPMAHRKPQNRTGKFRER
ncbi:MAG: DUF4091 domain-containing protein [Fimbriimonadales bacterium]|nr:DUF4091 domain-containing protein [Fimbriimonadales bacterium]